MKFNLLMFANAFDIAPMAHGYVAVVAAKLNLRTLGDDVAVTDTGIDSGLAATVTHGFDFFNAICQLHKPQAAGEKLGLEVRSQAKAQNGNVVSSTMLRS